MRLQRGMANMTRNQRRCLVAYSTWVGREEFQRTTVRSLVRRGYLRWRKPQGADGRHISAGITALGRKALEVTS